MKPIQLKVARIGNSRGVRIPATTLQRFHIGATVTMEELSDGILLRPAGHVDAKLPWDETAQAMSVEGETWTAWDSATGDGLEDARWDVSRPRLIAEGVPPAYIPPPRSRKR